MQAAVKGHSSIRRRQLRGVSTPPRAPRGFPHSWREGAERYTASASFYFVGALLVAGIPIGCEDIRGDFLPLEVGSSWTYRVVCEGRRLETDTIRILERLEHASGDGEEEAPSAAPKTPKEAPGETERFRVREPGAVSVWTKTGRDVFRILGDTVTQIIAHPPFVGSGWTDRGPRSGLQASRQGGSVYCKVAAREAVETPAGWFFDCVVVERHAEDFSSLVRQWFAPDVGLVKWRVERPGRPAVEWLLEEYRAGGRADAARDH